MSTRQSSAVPVPGLDLDGSMEDGNGVSPSKADAVASVTSDRFCPPMPLPAQQQSVDLTGLTLLTAEL